jgi:hypothetical protein
MERIPIQDPDASALKLRFGYGSQKIPLTRGRAAGEGDLLAFPQRNGVTNKKATSMHLRLDCG